MVYFFAVSGGLIMMWAPCVPGCMIHGMPGASGFSGRPVLSAVAYGMYTTERMYEFFTSPLFLL